MAVFGQVMLPSPHGPRMVPDQKCGRLELVRQTDHVGRVASLGKSCGEGDEESALRLPGEQRTLWLDDEHETATRDLAARLAVIF